MSKIHRLPEKCTLCEGPDIVYAEVSMAIKYRDDMNHVHTANLKLCVDCADSLSVGRHVETSPPPSKAKVADVAPLRTLPTHSTCRDCGNPAVVLTSRGPMCSTHAFG